MSEVAEANPIQDLIQNTIDQNYTSANGNFMDIMTLKMNDVLDQEKIRLADQIYNGVEGDEDEEEQLELDLVGDDEEISDESSEDQDFEEDGYEVDDEADDEPEETEEEDEE